MKASEFISEEKTRLDPKCWTGKKIGNPKTKVKGGVRVNNCVPAESIAEDRDKHYYQRNNIWRVMDGDEVVYEYKPERYEVVGAKKLLARFDDGGYDVTHVISPMGTITYLYGKPEDDMDEGVAEDNLKEFAPGSGGGDSGRWYTDDQMTDLVGDGWWNDLDISGDISKQEMIQEAQAWLDDQGYSVHVLNCKVNDDDMEWFIEGSFQNSRFANKGVAEGLTEEFDLIESIIEGIAAQNGVDVEAVWADLESLTEDELYAFAVTSQLNEDWQKANKRDKTDGMSQKAVNAYRRENPGSKLKTAVTTKPSKLKKGGKASKRRKSYCSRSRGQMKMHSISCAKTPDKAICKARRRWNC